jgi:hypothetical protein
MAKYQVTGTLTFNVDVDVEASSDEEADAAVRDMPYADLVEKAGAPYFEVESVIRIKK